MDGNRFDDLTRTLAGERGARTSRRVALKATAAGLLAALGVGTAAEAQVTQAQCGNVACRNNPGKCAAGCVCCDYSNGNSRCRPPGTCSPGVVLCPPGQVLGASGTCGATTTTTTTTTTTVPPCASDGDCGAGFCQGGTCVATLAGTCAAGADICTDYVESNACGNGTCACVQTGDGGSFCASVSSRVDPCVACEDCLPGQVCVQNGDGCCGDGFATLCVDPCPPQGGSFGCFTGETLIAMADGTAKPVARVEVGDRVLGQTGINRVESVERPRLGTRRLYALNGGPAFVTSGHPFLTEAGWKAVDPAATAVENPNLAVGRLAVGDRLLALAGVAVPALVGRWDGAVEPRFAAVDLGSLIGMPADPATPLYNLRLDGDHTYVANDLVVHNK